MIRDRQALLELMLAHHPALLSTEEIARALTAASDSFEERGRVEGALRELVAAGLVHRIGDFAFASLAASSFDRLRAG